MRRTRWSVLAGVTLATALAVGVPTGAALADTVPATPTGVTAAVRTNAAAVSWTPSTPTGSTITYRATASPGGASCATTSATCTVSSLSNGVSYTFTVTAETTAGTSAPSAPSNAVVPAVDVTPPTLFAAASSPSRVSMSGGDVAVGARLTDDISGIAGSTIGVSLRSPNGSLTNRVTIARFSGAADDASYAGWITVPSGAVPGRWTLVVWPVADAAGNSTGFITTDKSVQIGSPMPPTGVVASAQGGRNVLITWTAPTDDGGNVVTGYVVTNQYTGETSPVSGGTSATVNVGQLSPYTAVNFTVQAQNAGGLSDPSDMSQGITVPAIAPGAPTVTSIQVGAQSGAATLKWSTPPSNGSGINGYVATASPGGQTCRVHAAECVMTGLTGGTPYTFSVATIAGDGTVGTPGPVSAAATPISRPRTPASVTATSSGRYIDVRWSAAAPQGAAISSYRVVLHVSDATTVTRDAAGTETSLRVTGLRSGVRYRVAVSASNVMGTSIEQEALGSYAVFDEPVTPERSDRPTPTSTSKTSIGIRWTRTDVEHGGTSVTGYQVRILKGKHVVRTMSAKATKRTITIPRLKAKTTYTVQLRAKNTAGYGSWSKARTVRTR